MVLFVFKRIKWLFRVRLVCFEAPHVSLWAVWSGSLALLRVVARLGLFSLGVLPVGFSLKGLIMSLSYATKAATIACLLSLGFIAHEDDDCYYDSPADDEFGGPVVQAYIYLSQARYWCVDLDGGYRSPCVWNEPVTSWHTSATTVEFIAWLDKEHAGSNT